MNKNMKQYLSDAWNLVEDLSSTLSLIESEADIGRPSLTSKPPCVWQHSPLYADYEYSTGYPATVGRSGSLLCAVYSLAQWAGYRTCFPKFAEGLNAAGAFSGAYLYHPEAVESVVPNLRWNHERLSDWDCKSRQDWVSNPANLGFIQDVLQRNPLVVKMDFFSTTVFADPHVVLAYEYVEPPFDGSVEDDLLIMDPWTGTYTSVLTYFNPLWLRDGSMAEGVTKVQRTVIGARAFIVDYGKRKEDT